MPWTPPKYAEPDKTEWKPPAYASELSADDLVNEAKLSLDSPPPAESEIKINPSQFQEFLPPPARNESQFSEEQKKEMRKKLGYGRQDEQIFDLDKFTEGMTGFSRGISNFVGSQDWLPDNYKRAAATYGGMIPEGLNFIASVLADPTSAATSVGVARALTPRGKLAEIADEVIVPPVSTPKPVLDDAGRSIAPPQPEILPRPAGPWDEMNVKPSSVVAKTPEDLYNDARTRFGMGLDNPELVESAQLPTPPRVNVPEQIIPETSMFSREAEVIPKKELPEGQLSTEITSQFSPQKLETRPLTPEGNEWVPPAYAQLDDVSPSQVEPQIAGDIPPSNIPPQAAQLAPEGDPVSRLKDALKSGALQRAKQDELYSEARKTQVARMSGVTARGMEGINQKKAVLKGELPKLPTESRLTQDDVDSLADNILDSNLQEYQKINAASGLTKLLKGETPQRSEMALLNQVFGEDMSGLIELHAGLNLRPLINNAINLPKSLKATLDLSAPLRQGLPLIHKKEYWNAFANMFKYAGSEKVFNQHMDELGKRAFAQMSDDSGLFLAGLGEDLTKREEQFLNTWIGKIPLFGALHKGSERAYTGFLNQLRADTFDSLVRDAAKINGKTIHLNPEVDMGELSFVIQNAKDLTKNQKMKAMDALRQLKAGQVPRDKNLTFLNRAIGRDFKKYISGADPGEILSKNQLSEIAHFVNNATGRGSLGRLEKNAVELNAVLFSPRLMASRLTTLNPVYYIKADPFVRKEALKSLLAMGVAGTTMLALLNQAGAEIEADPTSSNFGKGKIGNVVFDPWGGFQQYITAAARLATGKTTSTRGTTRELGTGVTPSRLGLVAGFGNKYNPSFLENKLSPIAAFIDDLASGREFPVKGLAGEVAANRPSAKLLNMYTPMLIDDMIDIYKEDPSLLPLGISAAFGMGVQTQENEPTSPFKSFESSSFNDFGTQ